MEEDNDQRQQLDIDSRVQLGSSDQACKECHRRKARCNRALPTCDLCVRYRRHCLYEKHTKTPLTRRHLTEVEARLEQTEALLRRMRSVVPRRYWAASTKTSHQNNSTEVGVISNSEGDSLGDLVTNIDVEPLPPAENTHVIAIQPQNLSQSPTNPSPTPRNPPQLPLPAPLTYSNPRVPVALPSQPSPRPQPCDATRNTTDSDRMLEGPPEDDFDWCEKELPHITGLSPETAGDSAVVGDDDDSPASDGMAALAVNEKEAGYLGVASGAALLRLMEPKPRRRAPSRSHAALAAGLLQRFASPIVPQPNPNRHITDTMIDAYFSQYHVSYPILHEPTFRAQYSEVIPRPNGQCWTVLAYVVAAIGMWSSASSAAATDTLDLALFARARSMLSFDFLEVGNMTLVQALTLASNYQQKRDKPNSGYNYLGLAVRMAMGLGLHKEFQGWNISPLNMEIRRRVWWSLCVFDVGATITFSRPDVWPYNGIDVSLPLNVHDRDLTAASTAYPASEQGTSVTPYTAVATQARFHIATRQCYERVISKPFPSADELLRLDHECIGSWNASLPPFFQESPVSPLPPRYALCHAVMTWRLRNLRIIMYRPFVIRKAIHRPGVDDSQTQDTDNTNNKAYNRCLADAKDTIHRIADYWGRHEHNRLSAWYALYFLFQAALIPCICLRNEPSSPQSADWCEQIMTTLRTIASLETTNASSGRCYRVIYGLCGRYLNIPSSMVKPPAGVPTANTAAVPAHDFSTLDGDATPTRQQHTQSNNTDSWQMDLSSECIPPANISNVLSMMWPNMPFLEAGDDVMADNTGWMDFLRAGSMDEWAGQNSNP